MAGRRPRVLLVPSACPSSPLRPSPAGQPPAVTGSLPLPGAASGLSSEVHRLLWVSRDRAGRNCFSAQEAHCQAHAWPSFRATACVPRQRLGSQPGVPCCSPRPRMGWARSPTTPSQSPEGTRGLGSQPTQLPAAPPSRSPIWFPRVNPHPALKRRPRGKGDRKECGCPCQVRVPGWESVGGARALQSWPGLRGRPVGSTPWWLFPAAPRGVGGAQRPSCMLGARRTLAPPCALRTFISSRPSWHQTDRQTGRMLGEEREAGAPR